MAPAWSGAIISKEATTLITILAFNFSDPFPLFLVQDHFSCKYVPHIKGDCS